MLDLDFQNARSEMLRCRFKMDLLCRRTSIESRFCMLVIGVGLELLGVPSPP